MKILYLTSRFPFPADSGGPIKTLRTLKLLAKNHQLFLLCFAPSKQYLSHQGHLEKLCSEVRVFVSNLPFDHFKNIGSVILKSLFLPEPFIVYRHRDKRFKKAVDEILEKEKIDAIHIDHLNMSSYLPKKKNCLWVLEEHNIESEINWGIFKRERWNKFKLFSFLEALKSVVYEKRMISKFDYILTISRDDQRKLIRLGARKNNVFFLPAPFDINPRFCFKNQESVVLFVGMLSWWPNKDGLFWFYKSVFPLIKKEIADAEFLVIGKEATREMIGLDQKDPDFKLVGYVKDLEKYFGKAGVFIVPLQAGSGIRIKILTALSMGLPVVSTKKGAEGIVGKSGEGIILADSPNDFAQAVVEVLKNKSPAERLSKTGLDFIKKNYNEKKAKAVLEKVYK